MPVYLTYAIQLLLVIHVLKTGRNRYWILILVMLPMIGGLAYLVIEILPEFSNSITGQRAMRGVRRAVNPGAELRRHADAWSQSPNTDNARRYAQSLLEAGQHDQARQVLDTALAGFFSNEPNLLLLKAQLEFETGEPGAAVEILDRLTAENPDFKSAEGHLLYAQALEANGRTEDAIEAYRAVSTYFPGAEARYRLVNALAEAGHTAEARAEAARMLEDARLAPAHFRKSQKPWLDRTREAAKQLEA
ncbi:MAG: tetratricopeptide repeat protein [Xanthomonadales bacterium]|nr:tetratricopeptide repeat protein [Xanthomonadales bacterium]